MTRRIGLHGSWLVLACMLFAGLALTRGALPLSAEQLWHVLCGGGAANVRLIVLEWRLPRVLMALLIGAALGVILVGVLGAAGTAAGTGSAASSFAAKAA